MFAKQTCGLPSARPIFRTVEDAGPYNHNIKSATKSVGETFRLPFVLCNLVGGNPLSHGRYRFYYKNNTPESKPRGCLCFAIT